MPRRLAKVPVHGGFAIGYILPCPHGGWVNHLVGVIIYEDASYSRMSGWISEETTGVPKEGIIHDYRPTKEERRILQENWDEDCQGAGPLRLTGIMEMTYEELWTDNQS